MFKIFSTCICWCVTELNYKMHCATIKIFTGLVVRDLKIVSLSWGGYVKLYVHIAIFS